MIRIKVSANGPYRISAEDADQVLIVDEAGNVIPNPRPDKKAIALCRCGASMKKPYCDGTHKTLWPLTPAPDSVPVVRREVRPEALGTESE